MQITLFGAFLVPLSLYWIFNPVRLIQAALVTAVFEAAAALVLGGRFGLQPAMVPGLLFVACIAGQYALGTRYPGESGVFSLMLPLLALLLYALISVWLLPDAFAGMVMVFPQKLDPLAQGFVPLEFTFGNITQSLYLLVNIVTTGAIGVYLTRPGIPYSKLISAYMLGGYIVIILVFWQLAHSVAGVAFPDDLLHSNPGMAIVDQAIGSVPRMQGPFTEPAGLATYLCGVAFSSLWLGLRGYRIMHPDLLFALAVLGVLLSTSTSGIVTLAGGLPVILVMASVGGEPGALGRAGKTVAMLVLGAVFILGPIFILRPSLLNSVDTVLQTTLDKGDSQSYEQRTAADTGALEALRATYGLGAGWGSYRSSSLAPGILVNGGIFGFAMVLWMIVGMCRTGRRAHIAAQGHPAGLLVDGFSAALCGHLAAAMLSAPMITSQAFFLQLGAVIGGIIRMKADARLGRNA